MATPTLQQIEMAFIRDVKEHIKRSYTQRPVNTDNINSCTILIKDTVCDSLDISELITRQEDRYNIIIPAQDFQKLHGMTIHDWVIYLGEKVREKNMQKMVVATNGIKTIWRDKTDRAPNMFATFRTNNT